jgi:aminobenzoyl-glutamate utilization protein B
MATPIAHKGAVAGARVLARTALELFLRPDLLADARDYFENEQKAEQDYIPFITADDPPATHLNRHIMAEFRPLLEPFYYDPSRYDTYLEQLGVDYPTLRPDQWERVRAERMKDEG